jgi:2'-5' RNA ligase
VNHAGPDELAAATETAVIVPVPAADGVVDRHRRALDHSAVWGVPAHVTVLYPFVRPDRLTAGTIDRVRSAVVEVPAFECTFSQVRWFGDDVVWLSPDRPDPFRALTDAVWRRFPEHPPYGGAHPDVVPHLTVGSTRRGDLAELRRAAEDVRAGLPVSAWIDQVWLIAGTDAPGSWRTVSVVPLPSP